MKLYSGARQLQALVRLLRERESAERGSNPRTPIMHASCAQACTMSQIISTRIGQTMTRVTSQPSREAMGPGAAP